MSNGSPHETIVNSEISLEIASDSAPQKIVRKIVGTLIIRGLLIVEHPIALMSLSTGMLREVNKVPLINEAGFDIKAYKYGNIITKLQL